MKRIDADAGAAGGLFTNGSDAAGIEATIVEDWWLNGVQEELVTVIVAGSLALDGNSNGQLLAALRHLFIKQGDGVGQLTNDIHIGWGGAKLLLTVDATNEGAIALESFVNTQDAAYFGLANVHADAAVAAEAEYRVFNDAATLAAANGHADAAVANEATARYNADVAEASARVAQIADEATARYNADVNEGNVRAAQDGVTLAAAEAYADRYNGRRIIGISFFGASGLYTPPVGTNFLIVYLWGAGGGGGATGPGYAAGGGGGGGGYGVMVLGAIGAVYITIGLGGGGGVGAAANWGAAGGSSSFGPYMTASGGAGGQGVDAGGIGAGGAGGTAYGANIAAFTAGDGLSGQANAGIWMGGCGGWSVSQAGIAPGNVGQGVQGAGIAGGGSGGGQAGLCIVWAYT